MRRLGHQLVDQNRLGAELVAAVDQADLARDVRQIQRFFDRGVAAADDDDVLSLVEKAVAGRAGGNAFAHESLLGRQPEIARRCAGRDDQRVAGVFADVADQAQRTLAQRRGMNVVEDDLGVEAFGVLLKARHQLGALHAVGIGRPVVDIGRGHQLPALRQSGDQNRFQVGARGVYCRGKSGRAGAENQQAMVLGGHDAVDSLFIRVRNVPPDSNRCWGGSLRRKPALPRRRTVYNVLR